MDRIPPRSVVVPLVNRVIGSAFCAAIVLTGSSRPAHSEAPRNSPANIQAGPPRDDTVDLSKFVFESFPTEKELERLYPPNAISSRIEGSSAIQCISDQYGYLNDCVITVENPPEMGFGKATIDASKMIKVRKTMKDGRPVAGQRISIRFKWVFPTPRQEMIEDCYGNDPSRAIDACNALIDSGTETKSGLIVTHKTLGQAYFLKQLLRDPTGRSTESAMWVEAIHEFDVALELDGDGSHHFGLYVSRATVRNANCQLDAAIEDDSRAIALKPNDASPYFGRGLVWLRKGDAVRARTDFAKAHQLKPDTYPTPDQAFANPRPPACLQSTPAQN